MPGSYGNNREAGAEARKKKAKGLGFIGFILYECASGEVRPWRLARNAACGVVHHERFPRACLQDFLGLVSRFQ